MAIAPRNSRRILFRTGGVLLVFGFAPLAIYCTLAAITGDPGYSDNPVGLGLLTVVLGWPGLLLLLIGFCLGRQRADGAS